MKSEVLFRIALGVSFVLLSVIFVQGLIGGIPLLIDSGDPSGLFVPVAVGLFVVFMLAGEWYAARGD